MGAASIRSRDSILAMGSFRPLGSQETHPMRFASTTCDRTVSNRCGHRAGHAIRGFSMIELAVSLIIIAILLGSILVPLNSQVESRKYDETQRALERAREALLGYAAAYGYFPCPASATSNGQEAGANHATGACAVGLIGTTTFVGFLPAATLGLTATDSQGFAVDGWGLLQNRIRYAIYRDSALTSFLVRTNGMRSTGMGTIASTPMLYVCNSGSGVNPGINCGTAVTLTSNALVVIWSVGPNSTTSGGSSVHEQQNPNPSANPQTPDRIFVSQTKAGAPGDANEFDDVVTWISPPTLFNRMIAAGQLP